MALVTRSMVTTTAVVGAMLCYNTTAAVLVALAAGAPAETRSA